MAGINHPRVRVAYGQLTTTQVNDGTIVLAATTPTVAEAKITTTNVANTQTVIIDNLTFTANATQSVSLRRFDYDSNDNDTATSLAVCINDATYGVPNIVAAASANVVTLTRQAGHPHSPTMTPSAGTIVCVAATGALNLTGAAKEHQVTVVDAWVRAIGGAAGSNTSVDIETTAATPIKIAVFTRAGLAEGAVLRAGTATTGAATNLNLANAPGVGLRVLNVGTAMDTATALDYCIYYTIGKGNTAS